MKKTVKRDRKTGAYTYLGMPPVDHYMIRRITGNIHIGESCLSVVRKVIERTFKHGRKQWRDEVKHIRRYVIAAAIQHHRENGVEYRQVMNKSREEFVPSYFFDKETHNVLIAPPIIPADLAAMNS